MVQVMPSVDVNQLLFVTVVNRYIPLPHATLYHGAELDTTAGPVLEVQVVPSGDVPHDVVPDVARNCVPFHRICAQVVVAGNVRSVQVVPSGDVAAIVPL